MRQPIDLWRCAIVRHPAESLSNLLLTEDKLVWLPEMPRFTFRADPFGLWRGDLLYIFAEALDYRTRIGRIDVLIYDSAFKLLGVETVLSRPWHLSYPFVFEACGEIWMLPEAYRSGTLTLYRARSFPFAWEPVCNIPLDGPAIDATPLFHHGRWWLLYAPSTDATGRRSLLHAAWAERLTGPWRLHPLNPLRKDIASARPGGTPIHNSDGTIDLPVQDCRATYGGALRRLSIRRLDTMSFEAEDSAWLAAPPALAPFTRGLHTLSAAGPVSLIDLKRIDASWPANLVRLRGAVSRHFRESSSRC